MSVNSFDRFRPEGNTVVSFKYQKIWIIASFLKSVYSLSITIPAFMTSNENIGYINYKQ